MRRLLIAVLLLLGTASCFPELPDRTLVTNLRVLAINVDPATASLATWPPPVITVTALTVHPTDEDLDDATHTWSLDLPEGEDWDALRALLPEGPHGDSVEIDLGVFFEQRDEQIEFIQAVLPLNYLVETDDDHREAVKLVSFLMPDFSGDDDDSAGDDDDSAAPEDPGPPPATEEELTNLNPTITSITVGERTWTAAADELPGLGAPLYIGPIGLDGAVIEVGVDDDEVAGDLGLTLYRTAGCPSLSPELEEDGEGRYAGMMGGFGESDDPCGDDVHRVPRGGDDSPDWTVREVAWRPLEGETSDGVGLWLVLQDPDGGQIWQELRAEYEP
jgi:hypothetical protein